MYFYNARYYDPALGRFIQADTIVPNPGEPQAFNRYSYTLNNPLRYTDPSGHEWAEDPETGALTWKPGTKFVYATRTDLGERAQSQGSSNDCGPTSQAMVASIRFHEQGVGATLDAASYSQNLQDRSGILGFPNYRLTRFASRVANAWTAFQNGGTVGDIKGATSPQGMANAYNDFAKQAQSAGLPDIGEAEYRNRGTKANLIYNVDHDYITAIMLVWDPNQGGGAHWVNIVGYNAETDIFYLLDPAKVVNTTDPAQNIYEKSWTDLQQDWARQIPGLDYQQVMITYK